MEDDVQRYIDQMRQLDTGDIGDLSIAIPLEGPYNGQTFTADLSGSLIWTLYETFQKFGLVQGLAILAIDEAIRAELQEQQIPVNEITRNTIWMKLGALLSTGKAVSSDKPSPDAVLGFTYRLLRGKTITYNQAASIARILLKNDDITPDAWRKRIIRYVKKERLDPVEAPRGRPKQNRTD